MIATRFSETPNLDPSLPDPMQAIWNNTAAPYPHQHCVHQLFESQAEQTPEAVAVTFGSAQLTYHQLNERASQLARYLRRHGIGPDIRVGLCLERSLDLVVAILGVLKAGGVYVPLDPSYPAERLNLIMNDADALVLLTQARLTTIFTAAPVRTICLDTDWVEVAQELTANLDTETTPQNLAYIIYTSGSTGQPKGVAMPHQALCNLLAWQLQHSRSTISTRTLQFASFGFDVSFQEMFATWYSGGTLVLVPEAIRRDAYALLRLLSEEAIERVFLPFVVLQQLAKVANQYALWPSHLHEIITAGEQLQITGEIATLCSNLPGCTLWNQYGPTESHAVTALDLSGSPDEWPALPSIGRAISNTQLYILDEMLRPVPVGLSGDLYIAGDCLARGYLSQPGLTAERFVPNPFSAVVGTRMYQTGDVAHYLPDGTIEFLGRSDHQVKIRGFRVELGEIEVALGSHPMVSDAVVVAHEYLPGQKRLVGYVVANKQQQALDVQDLRAFLKERLPEYMVPVSFVMRAALPITVNGKVDRKALPAPVYSRSDLETTFVAPRNPAEKLLAAMWADMLGMEVVGVEDHFFELGGHSLIATQLISRIWDAFQVELTARSLFEAPTIAAIAEQILLSSTASHTAQTLPIQPAPLNVPLPLAFAQQRLWFLDQLVPGSSLYNIPATVQLSGALTIAALAGALNAIVRRHTILRTAFVTTAEGVAEQQVLEELTLDLPVIDLQSLPASAHDAEIERLIKAQAQQPFDLRQAPLLRAMLLQTAADNYLLALTIHHIIADGWSIGVLIREISALYSTLIGDQPQAANLLPALSIQYADVAYWQQQWLLSDAAQSQLSYWRRQLAGVPDVIELPTDRSRPAAPTFQGARQFLEFPVALRDKLAALSRQTDSTLFMTLFAAFNALLYHYTNQTDLVVGTPVANRNRTQLEPLIGFFANTLVLRTDLSTNPTFRELIAQAREVALQAYAHQDLPFEKLVDSLEIEHTLSYNPLVQVMFILQNAPLPRLELPGLTVSDLAIDRLDLGTAKFDLSFVIDETAQGLHLTIEYSTTLFDTTTISRMATHFQRILEHVVARPDDRIADLPLLTAPEQRQLLADWNATEASYTRDACVHDLFEMQVARTPQAVAVVFGGESLSYAELDRRANQLGRYLQQLGVGPETLVGLCLDRSFNLIIGLLGILKAGGAYVPLDPNYPQERLAYMLADAQLGLLVTESAFVEHLPVQHNPQIVCLDRDRSLVEQQACAALTYDEAKALTPESLAYIIYTSGSTGAAKGVQIAHRGVCNLVAAQREIFGVQPGDRVLQFSSISFDASVFEIVMALCAGATLYLGSLDDLLPGEPLLQLLQKHEISHVTFPPSVLATLSGATLPALRVITSAGEACSPDLVEQWTPQCRFFNAYGPTEATIWSTVAQCYDGRQTPPIGQPIANTQAYVLNRFLRPVPMGVPGELYISSLGLARGYRHRPALTAERFIPHPFCAQPGARLYKTGDVVRRRADGALEFLGRVDHQVKVRGYRIELGEIEATLSRHPAVREAVVIAHAQSQRNTRLIAYVVPNANQAQIEDRGPSAKDQSESAAQLPALNVAELRAFLIDRLPEYMVPAVFVPLPALPLTPNGKVDRKALPALERPRSDAGQPVVAPRNPVEEGVVAIWADVLGVQQIDVHDNFFELGGHSLLVTQVISRVRATFQVELPLRSLFSTPTVADFAELIIQREFEQADDTTLAEMLAAFEGLSDADLQAMLADSE